MAPARTVLLLGCWLALQSRVWGGMKFYLHKPGCTDQLQQEVPGGNVSGFPITKVSREDGGSYTCMYHPITDRNRWSDLSDPVELVVREPSHPKPSISLRPSRAASPGEAVTIRCWGTHLRMRFALIREGSRFPPQDGREFQAEFVIPSVSTEHSGSYSCYYHSKSDPFTVSEASDPMELVVRDHGYPRPKISLSNSGPIAPGQNVTIRCACQCQHRDLKFFLHKAGAQEMLQPVKTMGTKSPTEPCHPHCHCCGVCHPPSPPCGLPLLQKTARRETLGTNTEQGYEGSRGPRTCLFFCH